MILRALESYGTGNDGERMASVYMVPLDRKKKQLLMFHSTGNYSWKDLTEYFKTVDGILNDLQSNYVCLRWQILITQSDHKTIYIFWNATLQLLNIHNPYVSTWEEKTRNERSA